MNYRFISTGIKTIQTSFFISFLKTEKPKPLACSFLFLGDRVSIPQRESILAFVKCWPRTENGKKKLKKYGLGRGGEKARMLMLSKACCSLSKHLPPLSWVFEFDRVNW